MSIFAPPCLRVAGFANIAVAVFYDLTTPDIQNATAVLLGIWGMLFFVLAELRRAA